MRIFLAAVQTGRRTLYLAWLFYDINHEQLRLHLAGSLFV